MPRLKHEHPPKHVGTATPVLLMLHPKAAHFADVEKPLARQPGFIQLSFGPFAQWTAQPAIHRSVKTHFRTIE